MNIVVWPAGAGKYFAWIDGKYVCRSEQPLLDTAHVLLRRGVDPETVITMTHHGDDAWSLRGTVGQAARLTVKETPTGPKFRKRDDGDTVDELDEPAPEGPPILRPKGTTPERPHIAFLPEGLCEPSSESEPTVAPLQTAPSIAEGSDPNWWLRQDRSWMGVNRNRDELAGEAPIQPPPSTWVRENDGTFPAGDDAVLVERVAEYVYFIRPEGVPVVKIGVSRNPPQRLPDLQTGSWARLHLWETIPGGRAEELRWHQKWAHLRMEGEWFRLTDELKAAIGAAVS